MSKRCVLIIVALTAFVGSFASQGEAQPAKVDIRGSITMVSVAPEEARKKGTLGSIRVEGAKLPTTEYDKASIRITTKTKLEKLVGNERKPATFEELKQGVKVEATFVGPVAESYPVQATAGSVLILLEKK